MGVDELWQRLVADLDAWTSAVGLAPGRITVDVPGRASPVVVVMTADEWDDLVGVVMGGDVEGAVASVRQTLLALSLDEGFAVHEQYELVGAPTATLPEAPELPPGSGHWWAVGADGQRHAFEDPDGPDPRP